MGRPKGLYGSRDLTPELQNAICAKLVSGSTQRDACALAHLSYETFKRWLRKGDAGIEEYVGFTTHIRAAEAKCSDEMLELALDAERNGTDGKTYRWFLERRRWKDWDPKARAAHEANEIARNANLAALDDEELGEAFIQMAKTKAKTDPGFLVRLRDILDQIGPDNERVENPTVRSKR